MARRLGFATVREFEHWEEENVLDHFANFVCDYLGHGYTVVPEKKGFVEFVDLDDAVAARIQVLEERRFELALAPDKTECNADDWTRVGTAKDHYKQFIVGVVADELWMANHGIAKAEVSARGWSAKELTINMYKLLELLIQEWMSGTWQVGHRVKFRG
ncbi:hypothetical protein N656DRAFT_709341 [Canariomyces notabilis]|uniref:Uncharacterized protein n=1 Tax=Canariomyces notabilis TaxID=2074819 RepID=A0AAN6TDV3_9PEZI|nr:hypothetical protein N656DRAFT_709341 [Canariomyces arenarius]